MYDVIVIGGGPAGLTSALYLARAQYRVLVLEKKSFGGQITITTEVVNYPGVSTTDGAELAATMKKQAAAFGAEFMVTEAEALDLSGTVKKVKTSRGTLEAYSVILATGASPRRVGFTGEEEYQGRGVAYCATCDGEFFTGKEVLVIGGGYAAAEEAIFLTKYATHVTVLIRSDSFRCAKYAADRCLEHPKITVRYNTELLEAGGDAALKHATLRNNKTGEQELYKADNGFGVFVFAGYLPQTDLVKGLIELDEYGYVITRDGQKTSADGVFAAGDLCQKELRQVVTAVSDGATAATQAEKYVSLMQEQHGIIPERPSEVEAQAKAAREQIHTKQAAAAQPAAETANEPVNKTGKVLDANILAQLKGLFGRFEKQLELRVYQDVRPVSEELTRMMQETAEAGDKLSIKVIGADQHTDIVPLSERPVVQVYDAEGRHTGVGFHGVPGGQEFQSFVVGLYNAAGPGQDLSPSLHRRIKAIPAMKLQIAVSLSCTQCPDLVIAAQRLATAGTGITAEAYDINHFGDLRDAYDIMSVPCIIANDGEQVTFGKKSVEQLVEWLEAKAAVA